MLATSTNVNYYSLLSEKSTILHEKIHDHYINQYKKLLDENNIKDYNTDSIIHKYIGKIRNYAVQIYNFNFFKNILSNETTYPTGKIYNYIITGYKTYDNFLNEFKKETLKSINNKWIWFVYDKTIKNVYITSGSNYSPIIDDVTPLLVLDSWEHAYYSDYENKGDYVDEFFKHINWEYINLSIK